MTELETWNFYDLFSNQRRQLSSTGYDIHSAFSDITVYTNASHGSPQHDTQPLSNLFARFSLPQSLQAQLDSGDVTEVRVLRISAFRPSPRSVDPNIPPTRFIRRSPRKPNSAWFSVKRSMCLSHIYIAKANFFFSIKQMLRLFFFHLIALPWWSLLFMTLVWIVRLIKWVMPWEKFRWDEVMHLCQFFFDLCFDPVG